MLDLASSENQTGKPLEKPPTHRSSESDLTKGLDRSESTRRRSRHPRVSATVRLGNWESRRVQIWGCRRLVTCTGTTSAAQRGPMFRSATESRRMGRRPDALGRRAGGPAPGRAEAYRIRIFLPVTDRD